MRKESIFDMEVDILPQRFTGASFLRNALATEGEIDFRGLGTVTVVELFTPVDFRCQWEPYVTSNGLIIVYMEFPSSDSYLVFAIEDFLDKIRVV